MAYATFPAYDPEANSTRDKKALELSAPFGDGYTQVAGDGIHPYEESWSLSFIGLKADMVVIRNFLDDRIDGAVNDRFFLWTPVDEATEKTWHLDGGYSWTNAGNLTRRISFKIKRVWAA